MNPRIKIALAQYSPYLGLLVAIAIFSILSPRFPTASNAQVILGNIAEIGVLVIPLALLVISGTVDLSVGSIASLGAVLGGMTMVSTGSAIAGIAVAMVVGAVAGSINGALISGLGLNPIVVTLGFLSVWGGLALLITQGKAVAGLPEEYLDLVRTSFGPVSIQILFLALLVVCGWFVLERLPLGREILAIGGSKRAAHLAGVRVKTTQFGLFVVTGAFAGLAGMLLAGRLATAGPTQGVNLEINALLIILIGGVAFEGGSGKISGVVAGLLLIGVLNNGLIVVGVSQFLQSMIVGATLVVAVALDRTIRRSVRSAWSQLGVASLRRGASKVPS